MTGCIPRSWSAQEDSLLRQAVAEHGDEQAAWKTIADCVPGRSNKACRKVRPSLSAATTLLLLLIFFSDGSIPCRLRYERYFFSYYLHFRLTYLQTPWTPAEDALLLKLYATHSPPRWALIAKSIPGRTDDACSKRYRESLDPLLKRDNWTPEEDAKLIHLNKQLGSKWTQVGQAMGRSGLGCRNRSIFPLQSSFSLMICCRWRLLERKQRSKNLAVPQEATDDLMSYPPSEYHPPDHAVDTATPSPISYQPGSTEQLYPPLDGSFSENLPVTPPQPSARVPHPPLCSISADSSLSGALSAPASTPSPLRDNLPDPFASVSINSNCIATPQSPIADDLFEFSHPSPLSLQGHPPASLTDPDISIAENPDPCPAVVPGSPPEHSGADPGSAARISTPSPADPVPDRQQSSFPPRKRPRLSGTPANKQGEITRLSSHLPADLE